MQMCADYATTMASDSTIFKAEGANFNAFVINQWHIANHLFSLGLTTSKTQRANLNAFVINQWHIANHLFSLGLTVLKP